MPTTLTPTMTMHAPHKKGPAESEPQDCKDEWHTVARKQQPDRKMPHAKSRKGKPAPQKRNATSLAQIKLVKTEPRPSTTDVASTVSTDARSEDSRASAKKGMRVTVTGDDGRQSTRAITNERKLDIGIFFNEPISTDKRAISAWHRARTAEAHQECRDLREAAKAHARAEKAAAKSQARAQAKAIKDAAARESMKNNVIARIGNQFKALEIA